MTNMDRFFRTTWIVALAALAAQDLTAGLARAQATEANRVREFVLESAKTYVNPFMEVELDAVFTRPDGTQLRVPGFWSGGNRWCIRYSSAVVGTHTYRTRVLR